LLLEDTFAPLSAQGMAAGAVRCLHLSLPVALQILIVEPDDRLRDSVRLHLSLEGYECDARRQLDAAGDLAADRFDLAVVNVQTTRPGVPHYARDRAAKRVSTLLLAEPGRRGDALSALEQWADDYVTLPVEMRELIARAHALVRFTGQPPASSWCANNFNVLRTLPSSISLLSWHKTEFWGRRRAISHEMIC